MIYIHIRYSLFLDNLSNSAEKNLKLNLQVLNHYSWKMSSREDGVSVEHSRYMRRSQDFPMTVSMQLEIVGTRIIASSSAMMSRLDSSRVSV